MEHTKNQQQKFCHFLLTRFNVPAENKKYKKALSTKNWLEHRFNLFENYCLPSIKNQSKQDFVWLVFFDENTPEEYKKKIYQYVNEYPNLVPIWVEKLSLEQVKQSIRERTFQDQYILTTRLDNDDALHGAYFESLYKSISEQMQPPFALNCSQGIIYNQTKTYLHSNSSNAFISLYESIENFKTVWCEQHQNIEKIYKTIQIDSKTFWLQIVHGSNISNRIKGVRVNKDILAHFNFKLKPKPSTIDKVFTIIENTTLTPLRLLREFLILKLKK